MYNLVVSWGSLASLHLPPNLTTSYLHVIFWPSEESADHVDVRVLVQEGDNHTEDKDKNPFSSGKTSHCEAFEMVWIPVKRLKSLQFFILILSDYRSSMWKITVFIFEVFNLI